MKTSHSIAWKSSTQPRKQRKYRHKAPLHVKGTFLSAILVKELRDKQGTRRVRVRTGDKVRVMRGQFKGHEGKVDRVDTGAGKVFVAKAEFVKKDGATKVPYPLEPSNIMIMELDTSDKRRFKK
ncbi:50S ribosomal protein L24 [Candidatus Woesearchaeota archaeon]|nr:50S ribosomal protein L24 [Candidatus Woesearchaeota archaeon]